MTSAARRATRTLVDWLHTPAPARRLAALRILVAGYCTVFLLAKFPSYWSSATLPARQYEPVGVLWFSAGPLPVTVVRLGLVVAVLIGVLATLGWRWRLTGRVFALLFLLAATYRMSWGHVIHTEHLASLHLLILGSSAHAGDVWSIGTRQSEQPDGERATYGRPIQFMAVALVITYLLAGWMKLRNGGGDWLTGEVLRNQIAYDNLRKELLGSPHSPLGGWLVQYEWPFHPIAWITVAVEIGAPLALIRSRLRTVWALLAWGFHLGIVVLMAISFPYPLSGIAYACLFSPERLVARIGSAIRRTPSGTMETWLNSRTV